MSPQVFWSMAKPSETRRFLLMVKSTPTLAALASFTIFWGWGWRWAPRTSQCSRMTNWSNCCGLIQLLSQDPSKEVKDSFLSTCENKNPVQDEQLSPPSPYFSSSMDLFLTKDHSLTVSLKDSVKFVILLHKVWEKHPYHQDYLGFYTLDSHLLPPTVHGLLGTTRMLHVLMCNEQSKWSDMDCISEWMDCLKSFILLLMRSASFHSTFGKSKFYSWELKIAVPAQAEVHLIVNPFRKNMEWVNGKNLQLESPTCFTELYSEFHIVLFFGYDFTVLVSSHSGVFWCSRELFSVPKF